MNFFKKLKESYEFKYNLGFQSDSDFIKIFIEKFEKDIIPILELHSAFKELFKGGNEAHKEICQLINSMHQSKKDCLQKMEQNNTNKVLFSNSCFEIRINLNFESKILKFLQTLV